MDPLRELGKMLLLFGGLLVVIGGLLLLAGRGGLPFRIGRLPGDIIWQGKSTTFYFPIVTCLVLSVGLTLILWLVSAFKR